MSLYVVNGKNEWMNESLSLRSARKLAVDFWTIRLTYLFKLFSLSPLGSVLSVDERKLLKLGRSVLEFQLVQIQVDVFFCNIYHWCRRIVKALDLLITILWSIRGILNPWKLSFNEPPQFIYLREFRYLNARYVVNPELIHNIPSFDEPSQFIEGVIIFRRKWVIRQQNWGISLFKKQALDPVRTHINYQRGGSCYNDGNF